MIEISQLQTLIAVEKAGSFSRAAENLQVTQSAISQSIKNLENKLGVNLFRRSGKKVVLTPEGEKLYYLALEFLGQLENTIEEIKSDKSAVTGKVRIGTVTGIGKSWLAHELLDFSNEFPELTPIVQLGFQEDLIRDFEHYKLDLLVLPENDLPNWGEKILLSEEKSTLVFPNECNFDLDENVTLKQLSELPTILFEENDHLYYNWCRERFNKIPKKINVRYIVNSHGNMLQAVSKGMGIAVIPTHVLRRSYYRDRVSNFGSDFEVSNGKFYLVYYKESENLMRIKITLDRLVKSGRALSTDLWI